MVKATPKTHGSLIAAMNQIGIVCLQLESAEVPDNIKAQSAKVMGYVEACTDKLAPLITDATVRKIGKVGIDFHDRAKEMIVRSKAGEEYAPTVMARLMFGHLALIEELPRLKRKGHDFKGHCWNQLDRTAGKLLKMLCAGMPQYEERAFWLAAKMTEEIAA